MNLQTLRIGSRGDLVESWQNFLRGQDIYLGHVDGIFGPKTEEATKQYQRLHKNLLNPWGMPDGVVGPRTWGQAMSDGLDLLQDSPDANWPPKPANLNSLSSWEREQLFGKIEYVSAPHPNNPEAIKITNNWQTNNLGSVVIPQLKGVKGAPSSGRIFIHKKLEDQTKALFDAWEKEGLDKLIRTWEGSWVPRFVRGSRTTLSNHSYATAFDINYWWNKLGHRGALVGEPGSVRELVPLAEEHGFFWGGWWTRRPDPMHFEAYKVL